MPESPPWNTTSHAAMSLQTIAVFALPMLSYFLQMLYSARPTAYMMGQFSGAAGISNT